MLLWRLVEQVLKLLVALSCALRELLGASLGALGGLLGACCGPGGAFGGGLECQLAFPLLDSTWGPLGRFLDRLGCHLGRPAALLEASGAVLRRPVGPLGPFRTPWRSTVRIC
eukprot:367258-Pyramimonas_sp.AAC.1